MSLPLHCFIIVCLWSTSLLADGAAELPSKLGQLSEVEIGVANDPIRVLANQVSRDERHLASVVAREGKQQVVVDGKPGAMFEGTIALDTQGAIVFSPNGERVAYTVILGADRWQTVIDGKPGPIYDWVAKSIVFSPDSRRVAYQAGIKKRPEAVEREGGLYHLRLVVDEAEGPLHESISFSSPVFSPDSQRLAYVAKEGDKSVMIVDGRKERAYDKIGMGRPVFSADSRHMGYIAQDGDRWLVVMDGVPGPMQDYIPENSLVFSPDSSRWAYGVRSLVRGTDGNSEVFQVVLDGKAGEPYDAIEAILFSPDSRHVAYKARKNGLWRVVLDGNDGIEYPEIMDGWPVYSPDSSLLAYWMKTSTEKWTIFIARIAGNKDAGADTSLACPCRGISGGQYDGIVTESAVFSPDSRHLAFVAVSGDEKQVVVDGNIGERYTEVGGVCFSSDSRRTAYWALRNEKWRVITDSGQSGAEWDGIRGGVVFFGQQSDPNGVQMVYGAAQGDLRRLIVNGEPVGQAYDKIATGFAPLPQGNGFEVIAARNNKLYRVKWTSSGESLVAGNKPVAAPASRTAEKASPPERTLGILFTSRHHDFGQVTRGAKLRHDFIFTNATPLTVEIADVGSSCNCTKSTGWTTRVLPGDQGVIPVEVDTAYLLDGDFSRTVTIQFKGMPPIDLELAGTVQRLLEVRPSTVVFTLTPGKKAYAPAVVKISNHSNRPITLSPPKSDVTTFNAELKTVQVGREFQLVVRVAPEASGEATRGVITLQTSSPEFPSLSITAQTAPLVSSAAP